MLVNQLAVFMENQKGRLNALAKTLAAAKIDVINMSIADTEDFGLVRFITTDNAAATKALKASGFTVTSSDLIGIVIDDIPGSLAGVLDVLTEGEINIEYLYSYARTNGDKAIILFKVAEVERALSVLDTAGISCVDDVIA